MREPINTITHLFGAGFGLIALIVMIANAVVKHNMTYFIGGVIFGVSLILLYSASSIYHWFKGSEKTIKRLRKMDHSMIFVLIAGTYTPICLTVLKGEQGWILLGLVWGLAIIGTVSKILFINMPRWLSAGMYLFLGWLSLIFIVPIFNALPTGGFIWLVAGGLLYTVGSVFYATKSTRIKLGRFGFHEIFHLFILAGSLSHFILVNSYIFI